MNQEIIQMAREAGLHRQQHNLASNPVQYRFSYDGYEENLERFFHLAAEYEREACAKECEAVDANPHVVLHHAVVCAAAIRARGQS